MTKTGATALVTEEGQPLRPGDGAAGDADARRSRRPRRSRAIAARPRPVLSVPTTSSCSTPRRGRPGLPKCVMHTQKPVVRLSPVGRRGRRARPTTTCSSRPFRRRSASACGRSHFTPAILGCPTVLTDRFDPATCLDLIERHRVTVLACVSTQFIMMLNEQQVRPRDLSSLRCMFTGGEAVPYERAAEFEDRIGAIVLQFYGSNETGALSRTTVFDTRERRLRTAGSRPRRDAGPAVRHRRVRYHRSGASRDPRMPGTGDLPRVLRRRRGQPPARHAGRMDAHGRHRRDR